MFVIFTRDFFINYKVYLKADYFIQLKLKIIECRACECVFFEKSVEIWEKICYTFKQVLKTYFCLSSDFNREAIGCE